MSADQSTEHFPKKKEEGEEAEEKQVGPADLVAYQVWSNASHSERYASVDLAKQQLDQLKKDLYEKADRKVPLPKSVSLHAEDLKEAYLDRLGDEEWLSIDSDNVSVREFREGYGGEATKYNSKTVIRLSPQTLFEYRKGLSEDAMVYFGYSHSCKLGLLLSVVDKPDLTAWWKWAESFAPVRYCVIPIQSIHQRLLSHQELVDKSRLFRELSFPFGE